MRVIVESAGIRRRYLSVQRENSIVSKSRSSPSFRDTRYDVRLPMMRLISRNCLLEEYFFFFLYRFYVEKGAAGNDSETSRVKDVVKLRSRYINATR